METKSTVNLGTHTIAISGEFEYHECGECGATWGMTTGFIENRREDHRTWYCPNGHRWHFSGDSETERLRRSLRWEKDRAASLSAQLDQTEASRRAYKGQATKRKRELNRVKVGVCPCCHRTFQQLARHMEAKHPEFKP
jgi:hypothetical protein